MYERDFWQVVAQGLLKSDFEWLAPLRARVSGLIVFGCWDDGSANRRCREAYALLRILEATSAVVVDREVEYICNAQRWFQEARARYPQLLGPYDLEFVVSDMTQEADELGIDCFDLAYCSGVLYILKSDADQLQAAVNTMARVVRAGRWVVANEDEGLDRFFWEAGLERAKLSANAPAYAYCYRKPRPTGTR
jgi:hypothetical protein